MDLYLHIGTEKTGTTSIQHFMAHNRDVLRSQGVLYPRSPGETNHTGIAALAQSADHGELWQKLGITTLEERDNYAESLRSSLAEELSAGRFDRVVLSNEHCSSRLPQDDEVSTLHTFLSGLFSRIRIVVYLRRQDDLLVSTYSTGIKNGRTEMLQLPTERALGARYDYWQLLNRWSSVFGRENIICRKFEKQSFMSGDLMADFLGAVGCDADAPWEYPGNVNSSLDARSLEFLRLMNLHVTREERPRKLVPMLESLSKGPLIDLPERKRNKLMTLVRESNANVANEYFGGELIDSDDPLFLPRADTRERHRASALSIEEIVAFSAQLLSIENRPRRHRNRATAIGDPSGTQS